MEPPLVVLLREFKTTPVDSVRSVLIDATLLVLLLVGRANPSFVKNHKRLQAYSEQDFDLLDSFLARFQAIAVTPNALTEASTLALQISEPARSQIKAAIRDFFQVAAEIYVASNEATNARQFLCLGLSNTAQLEVSNTPLILTDDFAYLNSALSLGKTCFNFTHLREAAGITS